MSRKEEKALSVRRPIQIPMLIPEFHLTCGFSVVRYVFNEVRIMNVEFRIGNNL